MPLLMTKSFLVCNFLIKPTWKPTKCRVHRGWYLLTESYSFRARLINICPIGNKLLLIGSGCLEVCGEMTPLVGVVSECSLADY